MNLLSMALSLQSLFLQIIIQSFFLFTRKRNLTPRHNKVQMLLTKLSILQIVHSAGTNLIVADMLSRDFSQITNEMCQLQQKTLPPLIEFIQLKPNNSLKQIPCLVDHEVVLTTQTNDFHPILMVMINSHSKF